MPVRQHPLHVPSASPNVRTARSHAVTKPDKSVWRAIQTRLRAWSVSHLREQISTSSRDSCYEFRNFQQIPIRRRKTHGRWQHHGQILIPQGENNRETNATCPRRSSPFPQHFGSSNHSSRRWRRRRFPELCSAAGLQALTGSCIMPERSASATGNSPILQNQNKSAH